MNNILVLKAIQQKEMLIKLTSYSINKEQILKFFTECNLKASLIKPSVANVEVKEFDTISLNYKIPLIDMFLYCAVLKDYGLKHVQLRKFLPDSEVAILIGTKHNDTYLQLEKNHSYEVSHIVGRQGTFQQYSVKNSRHAFLKPMDINEFLQIDPNKPIADLIDELTNLKYSIREEPEYDNQFESTSEDNERNAFYTMTEGQDRNWEDEN